jgi:hypothetical protein
MSHRRAFFGKVVPEPVYDDALRPGRKPCGTKSNRHFMSTTRLGHMVQAQRSSASIADMATLKTINPDGGYIDYTDGGLGVRVWKDRCQAIAREGSAGGWYPREEAQALPLDPKIRDLPLAAGPVPALALEAGFLDSDELRHLLSGDLAFADALTIGAR